MSYKDEINKVKDEAIDYLTSAGIVLTKEEMDRFEVADFGLGRIRELGLQLITYINTERCCAKDLVLLPNQTCPQHYHPPVGDSPGKEETFRCRKGTVYLYVPGPKTENPVGQIPQYRSEYFTLNHEIVLKPGEQYTIEPNTPHWFQAGPEGAIVSEFSTKSTDENDIFLDPEIKRLPNYEE